MSSTAARRLARRSTRVWCLALSFVAILASCDGQYVHAGTTEDGATSRAQLAAASVTRYGGLTVQSIRPRTGPRGNEYWDAVLADRDGVARVCVRLSERTTTVRDCSQPSIDPNSGSNDEPEAQPA